METTLPKYVIVTSQFIHGDGPEGSTEVFKRVSALAEQGYRVHTVDFSENRVLMSLKSSPDIQNGEDFVNVPIGDEYMATAIQDGWIPIANYSKHVTLMKRGDRCDGCEIPCEGCERMTPEEAYEYVMENPPERGI